MQACRLSADDLACRRGDRLLFASLSLALENGTALHVTGTNGCGKSSLLRVLAGLLAPFAGSVSRSGMAGLIDERPALDPHLPLTRALAFWSALDSNPSAALDRLGLAALGDVPVRYLSTGQAKRAAFARLIAQNAPIWLLDEPLNGLDDAGAALALELSREHLASGGIAVIASHQPFALPGITRLILEDFKV